MLPRSTATRKPRDISRLKVDGRTMEIQRLIGRALRSVVDLKALGEKTIWIDCDVIQADGGTRTTSICGAFVALVDAMNKLHKHKPFEVYPIRKFLCATSAKVMFILPPPSIIRLPICTSATPTAPWPPTPWPAISGSRATMCAS